MPASDVYMILYARRAKYIRDKIEELKTKDNKSKKKPNMDAKSFAQLYGG